MRCFVAIELPDSIRSRLADLQTQLQTLGRAVRWTRPEHIHLTLKFLGEIADTRVPEVCAAVQAVASTLSPIHLSVRGAGCFPPSGPARILWAGVQGPPAELVACHQTCERALAQLGFAPENRAFRPHLTIARSRDRTGARGVRQIVEQFGDHELGTFTASELVVFQSVLGRSGPTYTALARAELNGL